MKDIKFVTYYRESATEVATEIDFGNPIMMSESGLNLLIQIVVINLLKTPGKDFYEPQIGGGLKKMLEADSVDKVELGIQANIKKAVAAVEYQIKQSQLGMNYPKSERLASLGISKENRIFILEDSRGIVVNIDISNEAGDRAVIALPIEGRDE